LCETPETSFASIKLESMSSSLRRIEFSDHLTGKGFFSEADMGFSAKRTPWMVGSILRRLPTMDGSDMYSFFYGGLLDKM